MPVEGLQFGGSVLIEELVNGQIASADFDIDLSPINLDTDSTRSELIHSFRLSHEHNLQLLLVRVVIDILSKLSINGIVFDRDVHCDPLFDIDNLRVLCRDFF